APSCSPSSARSDPRAPTTTWPTPTVAETRRRPARPRTSTSWWAASGRSWAEGGEAPYPWSKRRTASRIRPYRSGMSRPGTSETAQADRDVLGPLTEDEPAEHVVARLRHLETVFR